MERWRGSRGPPQCLVSTGQLPLQTEGQQVGAPHGAPFGWSWRGPGWGGSGEGCVCVWGGCRNRKEVEMGSHGVTHTPLKLCHHIIAPPVECGPQIPPTSPLSSPAPITPHASPPLPPTHLAECAPQVQGRPIPRLHQHGVHAVVPVQELNHRPRCIARGAVIMRCGATGGEGAGRGGGERGAVRPEHCDERF